MTGLRFRAPTVALSGMAAVLAVAPLAPPVFVDAAKRAVTAPALLADTALIMGGTGTPDPPQWFIDQLNDIYIQPNFPGYTPVGLYTPEEAWPMFGSMTGDESVAQGVENLHTAITDTYAGDDLLIFGVSQSAVIAGLEMQDLADDPPDGLGDLHFALLGDPASPAGGIFERLVGVNNPFVDLSLYPPTPTDAFPTDIYTGEYDGVADFPRYPLNIVSTLNALAGMATVHLGYEDLTADQIASATHLGHSGQTDFYMMPTDELPLLSPLYESDFGKVLADLMEPQLRVMVDLGYGNLDHAAVPDPGGVDAGAGIGMLPKLDPLAVLAALQLGQVEGTVNATNDVLGYAGLAPLPDSVTDLLKSTSGYDATVQWDEALTAELTQLSTQPGLSYLDPDVLFDGSPIFEGEPVVDMINQWINDTVGALGVGALGWLLGLL
jgi:hypothetical protein